MQSNDTSYGYCVCCNSPCARPPHGFLAECVCVCVCMCVCVCACTHSQKSAVQLLYVLQSTLSSPSKQIWQNMCVCVCACACVCVCACVYTLSKVCCTVSVFTALHPVLDLQIDLAECMCVCVCVCVRVRVYVRRIKSQLYSHCV